MSEFEQALNELIAKVNLFPDATHNRYVDEARARVVAMHETAVKERDRRQNLLDLQAERLLAALMERDNACGALQHAVDAQVIAESSLARLQADCDRMREALADIEKYPATRQDERSAADLRRVARLALASPTAPAQEDSNGSR